MLEGPLTPCGDFAEARRKWSVGDSEETEKVEMKT